MLLLFFTCSLLIEDDALIDSQVFHLGAADAAREFLLRGHIGGTAGAVRALRLLLITEDHVSVGGLQAETKRLGLKDLSAVRTMIGIPLRFHMKDVILIFKSKDVLQICSIVCKAFLLRVVGCGSRWSALPTFGALRLHGNAQ